MKEKTFNVYVPSYKRYDDKVRIYDHLEYCTYVVRESEADLYRQFGIDKLWVVPDKMIDNIHKVHQYIIDESPEDIICIIDDDGKLIYRTETTRDMTPEEGSMELERIAVMMDDLGLGYACTDAIPAPYYYVSEFVFKGMCGGCKWVNKEKFKAKVDPYCYYNFDLDLELQELLHNRIVLKPLYFIDIGGQDTNKGGSNVDKNKEKRMSGIEYTKKKWGKYFGYNYENNKARINVNR
jgi:hypothetical protein